MAFELLKKTAQAYLDNLTLNLSMGVLLVMVIVFLFFSNIFISSGSIFFEYSAQKLTLAKFAFEAAAGLFAIMLYSFFLSLILFSARSKAEKKIFYFQDRIKKLFTRVFSFFVIYAAILLVIGATMAAIGMPSHITALILLIISLFVFFVPQSLAVDEESLFTCFLKNIDFMLSNFPSYFTVLAISVIVLALVPVAEIFFDQFMYAGKYVSLILLLTVVIPFIETLKTKAYIRKYGLASIPFYE